MNSNSLLNVAAVILYLKRQTSKLRMIYPRRIHLQIVMNSRSRLLKIKWLKYVVPEMSQINSYG